MKKQYIIYVTLIALTSFLGSSCKDFLEEEPKSTWGVDSFYSTEAEAEIAIAGIYSVFASGSIYGHNLSIGMSSGTDEGYYNRRWNEGWPVGLYRHTGCITFCRKTLTFVNIPFKNKQLCLARKSF